MITPIRKLLVANRGEIAVRIQKTAHEMGIPTVAVYSVIDERAPHVRIADEAFNLGDAPARESYLVMEKIIEAAKHFNADAIHPGYGFLSENPLFADRLEQEGIRLVGPSAQSMRLMGNKATARSMAQAAGVPIVPGVTEPVETNEELERIAHDIGFPILLKAVGGGGGKGMRVVGNVSELASAYRSARSEARSAFGDDRVYIEKYLANPRHIEVQVLADSHGNVVHLGERECSIQRRHQKIIEESPSVALNDELRSRITHSAISLAKKSGYVNAGTMEFLLNDGREFYFLEMNTRLQVEHPVTEMRTGIDLVREQIRITEGHPLPFRQEDIVFRGAAIECRIYAEDSFNSFFPSTGTIHKLQTAHGINMREDTGVEQGSEVTSYYDPLLSKLIAWDLDRDSAIAKIIEALKHYQLYGIRSNIDLCLWVLSQPEFQHGSFDTNFLRDHFTPEMLPVPDDTECLVAAIAAALEYTRATGVQRAPQNGSSNHRWKEKRVENMRGSNG